MSSERSKQHAVVLPSGVRVERLPLGFADDHWWLLIVMSGSGRWARALEDDDHFYPDWLSSTVQLHGPNGPFRAFRGGGTGDCYLGNGDVFHAMYEFGELPWLGITYHHEGQTIDEERLDLSLP